MTRRTRPSRRRAPVAPRTARLLLLSVAALAATSSCGGGEGVDARPAVRFGIISTESQISLREQWTAFVAEMEAGLGIDVVPTYAPDYAGMIEAMRFGQIDIGWFGNKSAVEAVDRAGGEVVARTVDAEGNPGYWSVLLVHADSPFHTVDDLLEDPSGLTFGNGDPNSTSGNLVPSYHLWAKRGIDPERTFGQVVNGNHEINLFAVANRNVDCATNNTESLRTFRQENPGLAAKLREIWRSPLIPDDPIVVRKDLDPALRAKLVDWLLSFGRAEDPAERARQLEVLRATSSGLAPFVPSSDDQLVPIRLLMRFRERRQVEANPGLGDDERARRLAAVDAAIERLEARAAALEQAGGTDGDADEGTDGGSGR